MNNSFDKSYEFIIIVNVIFIIIKYRREVEKYNVLKQYDKYIEVGIFSHYAYLSIIYALS